MPILLDCLFVFIGVVVGAVIFIPIGIRYRKRVAEAQIGTAETAAKKIVDDAEKVAETRKKEALIEAKEEILRNKNDADRELKERRNEVSRLEKRVIQKEESIDKKLEQLEKKDEQLTRKIQDCEAKTQQIEQVRDQQVQMLQQVAGLTEEQAKQQLIAKIEEDARHDAAVRIMEIEQELKETADEKARDIVTLAIQRCAVDNAGEVTVSVVPLPSDDMKGRIIGREGRNIRTIETLTGVDLIIDDTPEAITLSSFDPVRREVARLSLEKLITDGRIHPARIEEMVEKAKRDVEMVIRTEGERAVFDLGLHGINPDLVRLLGRLKYRTSYGQNVLSHSIEVAHLSGMMASELGADAALARRAGLLHDIGKAVTHELEGSHVHLGVEIARKYKENKEVIHAIEAHHGDIEPQTVVAFIVQAADAISAARPGARRENLDNYIKRLEKLEEIANSFEGIERSFAIQAGREIRIMVRPEEVSDEQMVFIARDVVKKIEADLEHPGQIKVHVIRENRAIEYAK